MSTKHRNPWTTEVVADYVASHTAEPDALQQELIDETAAALGGRSRMQISSDEGAAISLLVRLIGASNAVEVGTFTGYSALCIARAIGPHGHLLCCDVSEEWTAIGRRYWERDGVADRIDLQIRPAIETLSALPLDEAIDIAFIDADKSSYLAYFEALLPRMRRNGLILVDNTLWGGTAAEPASADDDADTAAIKVFNDLIATDARVESYILPIADGLTLIRKR